MNLSEAAAFRELAAQVQTLSRRLADVERRLDDLSKAERLRTDRETGERKRG